MKKKTLTPEFWQRSRETTAAMKAYVAKLEQRIAEREAREQSA
jgi:hypothetical protein